LAAGFHSAKCGRCGWVTLGEQVDRLGNIDTSLVKRHLLLRKGAYSECGRHLLGSGFIGQLNATRGQSRFSRRTSQSLARCANIIIMRHKHLAVVNLECLEWSKLQRFQTFA